jgi:hypothetical protein
MIFLFTSLQLSLPPMAQKKLQRFAAIKTFSNVLEYPENMQCQWQGFLKTPTPLYWSWPVAAADSIPPATAFIFKVFAFFAGFFLSTRYVHKLCGASAEYALQ